MKRVTRDRSRCRRPFRCLASSLRRARPQAALARGGALGRCVALSESLALFLLFVLAYVGAWLAAAFSFATALAALLLAGASTACDASGPAAEQATAYLAAQIDEATGLGIKFCASDLDDAIAQVGVCSYAFA